MFDSVFRKINKSNFIPRARRINIDTADQYREDVDDEHSIWMALLRITSDSMWIYAMFLMSWSSILLASINVCGAFINRDSPVVMYDWFYLCDVCWFLDVVLRFISRYMPKIKTRSVTTNQPHILMYIIDLISVIPLEQFFVDTYVGRFVMINRWLKLVHTFLVFKHINSGYRVSIKVQILQLMFILSLEMAIISSVISFIECDQKKICRMDAKNGIPRMFSTVIAYLTGRGSNILVVRSEEKLIILIAMTVCYLGVAIRYTSIIIFVLRADYAQKSTFKTVLYALNDFFRRKFYHKEFLEYANAFFDNIWKVCGGYEGFMAETSDVRMDDLQVIIPKTMLVEVHFDIFFNAFSHSILFKSADVTYIRELSREMKAFVFTSQQFIFHREIQKQAMVYVFSGNIDIITKDDGDSAVISFSDGTCLGEISLLFPHKSIYKVRSASTCILHILTRKAFLKVSQKYPRYYNNILKLSKRRFEAAQLLHETKEFIFEHRNTNILSEEWLGNVLHFLMGLKGPKSAKLHALQNIYLQYNPKSTSFKKCLMTAKYLSLMVIKERRQSNTDTLFMKSTFIHIFRPNTGLTLCWDIFIGFLSLVAGNYIPYQSLVLRQYKKPNYTLIMFYTVMWWLDIFVKLRTAVQLKHGLIMKPLDILFYRLTQISFIFDIFAALPFEVLSGILVEEEFSNTLYINRMLKLTSAFQLLIRWEKRYNSNVLIVRLVYVSIFLIYGSFLLGNAYSLVDCLNDCTDYEVNRLIFYAAQGITGLDINVDGISENAKYEPYKIFMYLVSCIVIICVYALLFSAFVGSQFIKLKLQYENRVSIDIAKHLNKELTSRVENYIRMQTLVYNDDRNLQFLNIPKPMLGFWFDKLYVDSLMDLSIFKTFKRYVVIEILQSASRFEIIESNSVLYHVGDLLNHFVVIVTGSCELISGVDNRKEFITQVRVLNDLEVYLSLPSRNCVRTNTSAEIFYIDYVKYQQILNGFKIKFKRFNVLRKKIEAVTLKQVEFQDAHINITPSFVKYKGDGYINIFENNCQRLFFLPITINPNGKFAVCYEIFRSICGLISAFMYTTTGLIFFPPLHYISIILKILNLISIFDIYIRMHYCFYDENGIMITHPLKTSKYYKRHGMVPDIIGTLPTHWVVPTFNFFILNTTRLFQIHRYLGLIRYFRNNSITSLNYIHMLTFLPIVIIILNYLITMYIIFKCYIDIEQIFNSSPICKSGTVIDSLHFSHEFTAVSAHFYLLYASISLITGVGAEGFKTEEVESMNFISVLSFISCCSFGVVSGLFFNFFFCKTIERLRREISYKQLCKFIKEEKVKPKILKYVNKHLKRRYLVAPYNVHTISQNLPNYIIKDMLFVRFKSLVMTCLVGADDFILFIRNILIHTSYEVIENNGYIITLNDVTDQTLIIFSGIVEKIEADGTVVVDLKPGSILGNLGHSKYKRITNSFVAATTTEILTVDTIKFTKILHHFPKTKKLFKHLRSEHSTHIPGFSTFTKTTKTRKMSRKKNFYLIKFINLILLVIGAYFSQVIYLYEFSIFSCSLTLLIVNLFCDISFIISVIEAIILPNYKKNKSTVFSNKIFILALISLIPAYYFVYLQRTTNNTKCVLFLTLRSPVLIRIIYLKHWIKIKYSGHQFYSKLAYIVIIISLMLLYSSAIYQRLLSASKQMQGIDLNLTGFHNFAQWFQIVISMFTKTIEDDVYPITIYSAVVSIVLLLCVTFSLFLFYALMISLLNASYQNKWDYLIKVDMLLKLMNKFEASLPMIESVSSYSNLAWYKREGYKMPKLLYELPAYLKHAILFDAVGYVIDCHPLFAKCHRDMRRQLISKLKMEFYFHGDHVQYVDVADNTMYCVHYGDVLGFVTKVDGIEYCDSYYTTGDYFGIRQGVCRNEGHTRSYKVEVEACIIYLELDSWEYLMDFFPASKNIIFEEIKNLK